MPNVFLDGSVNLAGLSVPGVYGDIILPTPFIVGTPTNIEGLVGVASWGPVDSLIPASAVSDAALAMGPPVDRTHDIVSHIEAATQVGGEIGFLCIRVTDGTDSAASATITDANGGTGLTLTAKYTGTLGNQITCSIQYGALANSYLAVISFPGLAPAQFMNVPSGAANASGYITFTQNPVIVTAAAGASFTTSSSTITMAASLPATVVAGMDVYDTTASAHIGTVLSTSGTTLTLAANAAHASTGSSDSLVFAPQISLGGSTVKFVSSSPTGLQCLLGSTLGATMQNLIAFLNTSNDTNISQCNYSVPTGTGTLNIANKTAGTAGNSFTVTASAYQAIVSGATLSGGANAGNAFWVNLANAINNGNQFSGPSQTVVATADSGTGAPVLSQPVTLAGGTDGASGVTDAMLVGQDVLPRKGCYALRGSGCDGFTPIDLDTISYWAALASLGIQETMLPIVSTASGTAYETTISDRQNAGVDTPWMWIISGDWPTFYDGYNGLSRLINPTAFAIGIIGNLSPQESPLNKELLGISSTETSALGETYSDTDLTLINNGGIDVILPANQSPGGYYYSFATGRNASSDTAANGIEYTRMTNFLIRTAQSKAAGSFIGRLQSIQPDDQTRQQATDLFNGFSAELASPEVGLGINGQGMIDTPWLVQCNLANNPPGLQAEGYLFLYWQVRYLNVVRYFIVKFQGGGNVVVTTQSTPPVGFEASSQ
jgi:hypothetical protein